MKNGLFKLYANDYIKGLITAVFASIIVTVYSVTVGSDFDLFLVDWVQVGKDVANSSIITFVAYLAKNFLTTSKGEVLGIKKTK